MLHVRTTGLKCILLGKTWVYTNQYFDEVLYQDMLQLFKKHVKQNWVYTKFTNVDVQEKMDKMYIVLRIVACVRATCDVVEVKTAPYF